MVWNVKHKRHKTQKHKIPTGLKYQTLCSDRNKYKYTRRLLKAQHDGENKA